MEVYDVTLEVKGEIRFKYNSQVAQRRPSKGVLILLAFLPPCRRGCRYEALEL